VGAGNPIPVDWSKVAVERTLHRTAVAAEVGSLTEFAVLQRGGRTWIWVLHTLGRISLQGIWAARTPGKIA